MAKNITEMNSTLQSPQVHIKIDSAETIKERIPMYRTMKSCFCSIFQAVPGKAMRYMGCKAIAAILFPANVVLVERCISSMEGAFYREFWLTFPAFLLCAFVLVVTEHCGRVADMEFTQEFTDAYMPKVIHRLTGIR